MGVLVFEKRFDRASQGRIALVLEGYQDVMYGRPLLFDVGELREERHKGRRSDPLHDIEGGRANRHTRGSGVHLL